MGLWPALRLITSQKVQYLNNFFQFYLRQTQTPFCIQTVRETFLPGCGHVPLAGRTALWCSPFFLFKRRRSENLGTSSINHPRGSSPVTHTTIPRSHRRNCHDASCEIDYNKQRNWRGKWEPLRLTATWISDCWHAWAEGCHYKDGVLPKSTDELSVYSPCRLCIHECSQKWV